MARSWDAIRTTMTLRRSQDGASIRRMITVKDHVNADVAITVPKLPGEPNFEMLAPQLVADGIEFNALRAGEPMPNVSFPALTQTDKSRSYADIRQHAVYASWHQSQLPLLLYRGFRQLVGYGTCAFAVVPDFARAKKGRGGARVEIRDPLTAYPELRAAEDIRAPKNVGFVFGKSPDWIVANYPEARELIYGTNRKSAENETLWDLVEWIDEDNIVIGILGPRSMYLQAPSSTTPADGRDVLSAGGMELRRWDNQAGMVPVAVPRRVTLDRIAGQLESILPLQDWMGKLMALEVAAAEKGVLPDVVALGEPNMQPQLVGGEWHDGRTGKINLLQNVRAITQLQSGPSQNSMQILNLLERNARISGGVSPFGGGETPSSLRTGRAIDAMSGFSVDPRIKEIQTIMAYSLQVVNEGIIAVEKGYFPKGQASAKEGGSKEFVAFSGWPTDRGLVKYTPEQHFESDENTVSYCVDAETEILTNEGWRHYDEVQAGDTALTLNPGSGLSEWQAVDEVCVFPGPHRMVSMEGQDHSSLTTPNHRWLVETPKWKGSSYNAVRVGTKRHMTTTEALRFEDRIPLCAPYAEFPTEAKYTDALVEAVAWFWTEGSVHPGGVRIHQSLAVNPQNVARIRAALKTLFGPPVVRMPRTGKYVDRPPVWRDGWIGEKWVGYLSANAGRVLTEHAPGRVPTHEFLRSLTAAQLELFIQRSLDADGYRGGAGSRVQTGLSQKSRAAIDAFQFACTLSGWATSVREVPNGWKILLRTRTTMQPKRTVQRGSFKIESVEHDGIAWCPRTANGTWLARREGTTYWTGNTFPGSDVSEITVGVSQLAAGGLMSRHTARDKHPHIEDPEGEEQRIDEERVSDAIDMAMQQRLAAGEMDMMDGVAYLEKRQSGMSKVKAWAEVQQESQARQAAAEQARAMQPQAPEAQPGVNAPAIQGPNEGQRNVRDLVRAISAGQ